MHLKLVASTDKPPLGSLATAVLVKAFVPVEYVWGKETALTVDKRVTLDSDAAVSRYLARQAPNCNLYGANILQRTEVDHWLSYASGSMFRMQNYDDTMAYLDRTLTLVSYLVGNCISIADLVVWGVLHTNAQWQQDAKKYAGVARWYEFIRDHDAVKEILGALPPEVTQKSSNKNTSQRDVGKFVELPGAEMGKVIVRFPPEASGYLHIGHAKAALLNQYYQQSFKGKLIMRFDDTNPTKEKADFERVILEDLQLLQIHPDIFTHTSDHFDLIMSYCERLLKEGKAYVDDTDPETMKLEREQKTKSKNWSNSVDVNVAKWEEMKKGTEYGQKCCVRARIDMDSVNGCMRDPTIYRCKNDIHVRTGDKYKVYPTYDFACPIVDSIEGVTHALRTTEYHDRDAQFYWFIETLGLRKPYVWEYSRLNMMNTVLSKRKLTWFVEEGIVDGWDDPRFPTVRGILRRGMTVEGLKQFIIAQGSSKSVVNMEWDKIWAFNKKIIDPVAPRYTTIDKEKWVPVYVDDAKEECVTAPKHPKNQDVGNKSVWTSKKVLIDAGDAELLKTGENATFINWGNLLIKELKYEGQKITAVHAQTNLDNKDYKKTPKLTWLAETEKAPFVPCICVYFEHIISKPVLGKDEDFKEYIEKNSRIEVAMLGDPELKTLKKSDIIQLQRRGFFICDIPYAPPSIYTGCETPVVLFAIPDGTTKESDTSAPKKPKSESAEKGSGDASNLDSKIRIQGDKVRNLKEQKADKKTIDEAVKVLMSLKADFKKVDGRDWKPDITVTADVKSPTATSSASDLHKQIQQQGDKVRALKAAKAPKGEIDAAVSMLLSLKANFKNIDGRDWKPDITVVCKETSPAAKENPSPSNTTDAVGLDNQIREQGDKVRALKTEKAPKADVEKAVKVLLSLKADFKAVDGRDWKPDITVVSKESSPAANEKSSPSNTADAFELDKQIREQGDKVRALKAEKAPKDDVDKAVKLLLSLKADFKAVDGRDWKPDTKVVRKETSPPAVKEKSPPASAESASDLDRQIRQQGDQVRTLKANKAPKEDIDKAVKILLSLKANFKNVDGRDWKPDIVVAAEKPPSPDDAVALKVKIDDQGNRVRQLKSQNAPKDQVDAAVKSLLELKAKYKDVTGEDLAKPARPAKNTKPPTKEKSPAPVKEEGSAKKQTRLGLEATKEDDLPNWYSQLITKSEMIEYYDVSGCYILRPWSHSIWKRIQAWFSNEIEKLGVEDCYFPIFVSNDALEREKTHIADFAPEVAWVTKSGSTDLAEPIAIRPTSETVMYPAYSNWIRSHRDLPLKLNQWNNVVRWEFKHPQPFIRTREFLWQEGHTAFASQQEAVEEVYTIIDLYARIYTDLLAIPVIKGKKTEKEKFAGGDFTTTVEGYVTASGRGIQGATSHHLGQNFSKMFDIVFEDPETMEKRYVYQNSWGITTRTIGVMVMVHGDNKGLVLPPRVAHVQVVVVPCGISASLKEADKTALVDTCDEYAKALVTVGLRAHSDVRDNYSPGWKFNHWELKGVPIRVEIGPRDVKQQQYVAVLRHTGEKLTMKSATMASDILNLLEKIHNEMLDSATKDMQSHLKQSYSWDEFCSHLESNNMIMSPFCGDTACEDAIKKDSASKEAEPGAPAMGAKSLCIPFKQPAEIKPNDKCIYPKCKNKPQFYTVFGRSY